MILIGSRALKLRAPNLISRNPVDFDFLCTESEYNSFIEQNSHKIKPTKLYSPKANKKVVEGEINCEFEIITPGSSAEMLNTIVENDSSTLDTKSIFGLVPNVDLLFTIKSSHKYLKNSPYFWKTAYDYHVMKAAGAVIRPEYEEFHKLREKETYDYSHPKLNTSKENFFKDDNITYFYNHDDIHKSVKHLEKPAYLYYMKDGSEVFSDKKKFFEVDNIIRLYGGVEEATVLAIERSLVPHPGIKSPLEAWRFALSKVCSSLTSGFFRKFCYLNIFKILKMYPEGYWEKFQKDVTNGLVKKINQ